MSESEKFLVPGVRAWSHQDSVEWLNREGVPLFPDCLLWPDDRDVIRLVAPAHPCLKGGYGKWLKDTPYFPGLFELVHGLVADWGLRLPAEGGGQGGGPSGPALPSGNEVLQELRRIRAEREGQGSLF